MTDTVFIDWDGQFSNTENENQTIEVSRTAALVIRNSKKPAELLRASLDACAWCVVTSGLH